MIKQRRKGFIEVQFEELYADVPYEQRECLH
jgi:hypothetical protein